MLNAFIAKLGISLEERGYLLGAPSDLPGIPALLYAYSPRRLRLGFAKVEDHFIFVDWDNVAFGRMERLLELASRFSKQVNQRFPMPHALRLQIPNLAVAAISPGTFPPEAARFARSQNLVPWYGGETNQILLVSLADRQIVSRNLRSFGRYPIPGGLPLGHAASVIREVCQSGFD